MPDLIAWLTGSVTKTMPGAGGVLLCTACSFLFGLGIAWAYMFRNKHSRSLAVTLALLPMIVQLVIMLVNGNIGVGVAVAGSFSLVRFRSLPGNARDISCLFFAMAIGLATGMGYVFYALLFSLIVGGAYLLLTHSGFGQGDADLRVLRIAIPESLDYETLFDEVFAQFTAGAQLQQVRTTSMGSLYELTYHVRLKDASMPKAFLDALRCRNGNLNVMMSREMPNAEEL